MKNYILYIFISFCSLGFSQESLPELLNKYNNNSVPYIFVEELAIPKNEVVILDAREPLEYKVSHLKNAICVGYDDFNLKKTIKKLSDKQQTIVVYCSLGIRSEDIGEKLKKAGYTNVYNLYGGIFEWKNKDFKVYNTENSETENVHTFNEAWSKWLLKGNKVYEK